MHLGEGEDGLASEGVGHGDGTGGGTGRMGLGLVDGDAREAVAAAVARQGQVRDARRAGVGVARKSEALHRVVEDEAEPRAAEAADGEQQRLEGQIVARRPQRLDGAEARDRREQAEQDRRAEARAVAAMDVDEREVFRPPPVRELVAARENRVLVQRACRAEPGVETGGGGVGARGEERAGLRFGERRRAARGERRDEAPVVEEDPGRLNGASHVHLPETRPRRRAGGSPTRPRRTRRRRRRGSPWRARAPTVPRPEARAGRSRR